MARIITHPPIGRAGLPGWHADDWPVAAVFVFLARGAIALGVYSLLLLSWLAVRTGLMLSPLAVLLLSALMAWGTCRVYGVVSSPLGARRPGAAVGLYGTLMVVALLLSALVAELSANERALAVCPEGADTGVWDWHARSQRIQYSPRWRMLLGVSAAELGNKLTGWETRVHPDDLPVLLP